MRKYRYTPHRTIQKVVLVLLFLPLAANAFQLNPSVIQDPEGTTVTLNMTIEPSDWRVPNSEFEAICEGAGLGTNWVASYNFVGQSDSAIFSNGPSSGDVHFLVGTSARPTSDWWITCSGSEANPGTQIETFMKVVLIDDSESEDLEHAVAQIWDHDFSHNLTLNDSTDIFIEDNDAAAVPGEFNLSCEPTIDEDSFDVSCWVSRISGSDGAVSVLIGTQPGSAQPGSDYVSNSTTLNWGDADSGDKMFEVQMVNDALYEDSETFQVVISNPTGGATIGTDSATITILDDDLYDLAITSSVMNSSPELNPGDQIQFNVSVSNLGSVTSVPVDLGVGIYDYGELNSFSIGSFAPGQSGSYVISGTVPDIEPGFWEAGPCVLDPDTGAFIFDSNNGNNCSVYDIEILAPVTGVTIDSFTATPGAIDAGDGTTLAWTVSGADSCTPSGGAPGWSGTTITLPSGSQTLAISTGGDYTFTLSCSNASGGSDQKSVTVNVCQPFLDVFCPGTDPQSLVEGCVAQINGVVNSQCGPFPISWSWGDGSTEDSLFPASHAYAENGSYNVTVTAGEFTEQCTVNITACDFEIPVTIDSFTATPDIIDEGGSTTLAWDVTGADNCTATGGAPGWAGSTIALPSGSQTLAIANEGVYTFTLNCTNETGGAAVRSATVTVEGIAPVEIVSFTATPGTIEEGDSTTLAWSVTGADSCTASGGAPGWSGSAIGLPSGSQTLAIATEGVYTFNLDCSNESGGADSDSVSVTVTGEQVPDLVILSMSTDQSSLSRNETLRMEAVVSNAGDGPAPGTTVRFYLSDNTTITPQDTALETVPTPVINPGASFLAVGNAVISADPGTYWVGACADTVIGEANGNNNCSAGVPLTVDSDSTPCNTSPVSCEETVGGNLTTADCTSGPRGAGHFAESFTISRQPGEQLFLQANWSGFDGYLYLEGPNGLVVASNNDFEGAANSRIEYEAGQGGTYTVWTSTFSPGDTGSYDLLVNCQSPAGPDLTVGLPTVDSGTLVPGQSLTVEAELLNVGDQGSDSTTLRYVLSSDATIDLSDALLGSDGAPGLAAGASVSQSLAFTAPLTPGSYFLGVCAEEVAGESSTSNNCSPGRQIEVNDRPVCTRRSLSCGELRSGDLNTADCTGSPRGDGFLAEVFDVNLSSGTEVVIDAGWQGLDGYLILARDGVVIDENDDGGPGSRIEYEALQDGTHQLWVTSFRRNASGSFSVDLTCGSASAPDLQASTVTLDATETSVNSAITLQATIRNDGTASSTSTTVRVMLSTDETISPTDQVLTSRSFAALNPGGSQIVQVTVNAPSQPGNYWLGVCVDPVAGETLQDNNCSFVTEPGALASVQRSGPEKERSTPLKTKKKGTLIKVGKGLSCLQNTLICGQTVSDVSLGSGDCDLSPRGSGFVAQRYLHNGNAGDIISVDIEWDNVDGYLYVVDPNDEEISENDDFKTPGRSRVEKQLPVSGLYQIWPTVFDKSGSGDYTLTLTCNQPKAPDLSVTSTTVSDESVRPGQTVEITTDVRNQGQEESQETQVEFVLSPSPALTDNDRVLGTSDVGVLQSGNVSTEALSVALDVTPGTYWVGSCVNADTTELDTSNNCEVTGPITVQQTDEPIPINQGLNDAWYNPETAGQGFFINVFPDSNLMFLSWFTFDTERPPSEVSAQLGDPGHRWLTAQGLYELGVAELDVYLTEDGVFDSGDPPADAPVLYGSMTVSFSDCMNGQIDFDLPEINESGSIPITRIVADNVPECEDWVGDLQSLSAIPDDDISRLERAAAVSVTEVDGEGGSSFSYNNALNDAWYNPETNGQGFFFNIYPFQELVFLSWFTYEVEPVSESTPHDLESPSHRWVTAVGNYSGDTAHLDVYNTPNGVFNAGQLDPANNEKIGTITARFEDCNSGEVSYDIWTIGQTGVVPIERPALDTIPSCEEKAREGSYNSEAVSPDDKQELENLCGPSVDWSFDWPDIENASGYVLQLQRADSLVPTVNVGVKGSAYTYRKEAAIPNEHTSGWRWRYRPVYTGLGSREGEWSRYYTFEVRPEESPCLN